MLNPSIADENVLDPTLRRCRGFAERWGMGSMIVTNLFPLVATDPAELLRAHDRDGEIMEAAFNVHFTTTQLFNHRYIDDACKAADVTVVGWGTNVRRKPLADAVAKVYRILEPHHPQCLRATRDGHPQHPLYLPGDCKLSEWKP